MWLGAERGRDDMGPIGEDRFAPVDAGFRGGAGSTRASKEGYQKKDGAAFQVLIFYPLSIMPDF